MGFKTRFTNLINTYARELGILKEKDTNFTGADTRNGMTAVVAVKTGLIPSSRARQRRNWPAQTLQRPYFPSAVRRLHSFFDRNLEVLKSIIACAEKSAKIRKAEEKARTNMLSKSRFSFDSNGKLANCESRDPSDARSSSSREILPEDRQKWAGTASTRRSCPSGERS